MGYASIQHVPRMYKHAEAKRFHDKTTPIRGTTTRPLGRRHDHRMYSIRETKTGAIELVCYNTPVVTLEANNTARVRIDGWNSVSTRQFIRQTLGILTERKGNYCVLEIRGEKHTIKGGEELRLAWGAGEWTNGWTVLNDHPRMSYRINRKAANNVRARFKPFTDYLKGFVALRTETVTVDMRHVGMRSMVGITPYSFKAIPLSLAEMADAFGVRELGDRPTYARSINAAGSPNGITLAHRTVVLPGVLALTQPKIVHGHDSQKMLELVSSEDHEKFYKAALWLCSPGGDVQLAYNALEANDKKMNIGPTVPMKTFDKFIMMYHAQEIIEVYPTPAGKLPSEQYKEWLNKG